MKFKKLLLIGGGGHCKSVLDSIIDKDDYADIGIIDKKEICHGSILGINIIGRDSELEYYYNIGYQYAFITVGNIGTPKIRIKLYELVKKIGFEVPNIIDDSACVSRFANLGRGVFIGKHAVVNAGSLIRDCAIINTNSVIEHDCAIGEFVNVAPGTVICGNVTVDKNSFIGAKSVIRQQLIIGSDTIIGMGSTVLNNIPKNVLAYGNPCKVIKIND